MIDGREVSFFVPEKKNYILEVPVFSMTYFFNSFDR